MSAESYPYPPDCDHGNRVLLEYVWIDGTGQNYRSKTKVVEQEPQHFSECPVWNYDGSSTYQAMGHDSEVFITPRAMFRDPFRRGNSKLILCDCTTPAGEPIASNTRANAVTIFEQAKELVPWFGIEQEYTLFKDGAPLGWPRSGARSFGGPCVQLGYPGPQGPYYCGAGFDVSFGRQFSDNHLKACLYAGVTISGTNGEVMPGQWEYQVGPCEGIDSGDHTHISRYIAHRVGELMGLIVSLDPKPIPGDWNGAGCHTNFSTLPMRSPGGFKVILDAVEKLGKKHMKHVEVYGEGNDRRMTGAHETSRLDEFSSGVANRGCSVRIPRFTERDDCGYFEDRRPASNMDPYIVTPLLVETCCLDP